MLKKLKKKLIKSLIYFSAFVLILNTLSLGAFFNAPKALAAVSINPGDIIVNEIMKDPSAVNDNLGEWFELYNTTGQSIDLVGCIISDNAGTSTDSHTISTSTIIASYDHAVLGIEDNTLTNGGVNIDYEYSNFVLANADDEIILTCDSVEIDKVEYDDGPNFPDPTGISMALADSDLDNNIGHNWCESNSTYGSGDKGTPGSANDSCYAVIAGYKYQDLDNNTTTTEYLANPVADWQIYLFDSFNQTTTTATTTATGYFEFNQLLPENYTLSEQQKTNWIALSPTSTNISLASQTTSTTNFINYEQPPGILEIYKYEDMDGIASTTADQTLATSTIWSFEIDSGTSTTTATTTLGYISKTLDIGEYTITEEVLNNWFVINPINGATTTEIITGATTTINFYNTKYSTIYGYKYQDQDNNSTTDEYLNYPVENWEINLFDSNSTSTPVTSTTTNNLGYFEFNNLIPENYLVTEQEKENWTALSSTSTSFILTSSTTTSTIFVNYYDEEQNGSKQELGANTGGGGAPKNNGKVDLTFNYPYEKDLNKTYIETIVVSNKGNIVLTNGVLTLDLPQDKLHLITSEPAWYDYNYDDEVAVWHIPTIMVGQELSFEIEVEPLIEGIAETLVYVIFDQDSKQGTMTENLILIGGIGGVPEKSEPKQEGSTQSDGANTEEGIGEIAGEVIEQNGSKQELGANKKEENGNVKGATEPKTEKIFTLNWWQWAIIIILLLALIMGYYFRLKEQDGSKQELGANIKIKFSDWVAWVGGAVVLGFMSWILTRFCNFEPLWLGPLILGIFFLLLLTNYLNKFKIKKLGIIFSLLLLALPIIVFIVAGVWAWWMWLLVIGFYFLCLAFYFMGILLENYWQVSVPLSVFLILMLLFLIR